jgi:hypothetical protein
MIFLELLLYYKFNFNEFDHVSIKVGARALSEVTVDLFEVIAFELLFYEGGDFALITKMSKS